MVAAAGVVSLVSVALVAAVSVAGAVAAGSADFDTVPFSAWSASTNCGGAIAASLACSGAIAASLACSGAIAASLACSGASAGSPSMVLSGEAVSSVGVLLSDGAIAGGSEDSFSCLRNWSIATLVAALLKE